MDDEKLDYKTYAAKNLMLILYYGNVTKVKKMGINNSKTPLLITDRQILFFNATKKDPFMWLNIKSLSYTDKQIEIAFDGKKEIIFSLPKAELLEVFGIIVDLLRRILTKKQKEKIQLNQFLSAQQKSLPSSGFSLISRFLGNADIHSKNGKNFIETLQAFLMIQSPTISNISFKPFDVQEEVVPLLLDLLPFIKSAEHFQIVNSSNTFQLLTKCITHFDNIVQLSISANQDKENFNQFISELKSGKTAIEGIDFSFIQFEEEEFKNICKAVKSTRMCSFGLNANSISKKYLKSNKFYDDFETNNYLLYLNFNKFYNLNFEKIAPKIRNISILSIAHCNIEISSIFQILNDEEFPKLSELDISGNVINQQISSKNVLPSNLYKIVANKIEWKSAEFLKFFFSFIFKQMNSVLNLSIAEVSFRERKPDENWSLFFQYLSLIDVKKIKLNSIISFCWDGNQISSEFFDFMRKCRKLENLSISYCFKDKDSISLICEYLINAKTIKKLVLRGSEDCKLRSYFTEYIAKSIEEMKSIKQLDVSNNSIGDDGINSLRNIIKKKQQIEIVVFDNSDPKSVSPLLNIFSFCMKINQSDSSLNAQSIPKIKLSFPINDIYSLRDSKKVQKNELKALKSYCQCMIDSNLVPNTNSSSIDSRFPFPQNSPLDQPYFTFFSFHMLDDFQLPEYIKRGSFRTAQLISQNDEIDENENEDNFDKKPKREKKERTKSKQSESENDDDEDNKEITKKQKKNHIRIYDQLKTDSSSGLDDFSQRKVSQKRKVKNRENFGEEEDENSQRKLKNKSIYRRKSDTRYVKSKRKFENSEDDDYEVANSSRNKLKNTQRNKRRNYDIYSIENENKNGEEEEKPRSRKKKSYDEPINDESDNDEQIRNKKYKKNNSFSNDFDFNENDQNQQKNLSILIDNKKGNFSKTMIPKRKHIQNENIINNDSNNINNNNNNDHSLDSLWTFPFQPVSVPADNNSYIKGIDSKYSIVALTKMITNE